MASKNFVFKGRAFWAKVYEGMHDEYSGKTFYKISVELDDESEALFNQSKLKLKHRDFEFDGKTIQIVQFRRDVEPKVFANGTSIGGGVPRVVDANGDEMTSDQLIGNGSDVEVLVQRYIPKTMKSMIGHRLEAVKVTKLIPYEPLDEDDEEEDYTPPLKDVPAEPKGKAKNKALPF